MVASQRFLVFRHPKFFSPILLEKEWLMKNEDIKEHDNNNETSKMRKNREALITESEIIWNKGDFRKSKFYYYGTG